MRIAREGIRILVFPVFGAIVAGVLSLRFGLIALIAFAILILFAAGVCWFFRDPERTIAARPGTVLSPADGAVTVAESLADGRRQVSTFLSLIDVHVNRIPVDGTVAAVERRRGRYFHAASSRAGTTNARVRVELATDHGPVQVIQISGMLARRISCRLKTGDRVVAGQRYGIIYCGSRVDVVLPATAELRVRPGTRVRAGQTEIACMISPEGKPI